MDLSVFLPCPALSPELAPSQQVGRPLESCGTWAPQRAAQGAWREAAPAPACVCRGPSGVYDRKAL